MGLKKFKPTTPGQRHKIISDYSDVSKNAPEKSLVKGRSKSGGRNNDGRMTMRYIGGGHKQKYREIDFKREKHGVPATVKSIEYDPNRTARIALLYYADGEKRYIVAPEGLKEGDKVMSGAEATPNVGNAMFLADIPLGTVIHNIEMKPGKGGAIARGAGTYAQLNARDGRYAIVKMPSGETRMILTTCLATIGSVSNSEHNLSVSGKAGRTRWQGRRPRVRGVVMNPVDHPMGGGEGKNSGGHPRSRNGIPAKGFKTRSKKKYSNKFIVERRKK
ncbi:MAG: large subunit ribosomal protein L2 [Crocinitomicaceae bacterium]|jgi:large subunit ribosomal protein L2|nr:50S ribosomal protein L2 [Crocinitomicaceae bacterium]MDC0098690.1 50S ribosomal protein L2 [Crocinitomicaceae bacterium]|tara:strand:+ start:123 stop:947 length:825 start_codon:yes stop_codon:yes gene_type:complete